MTSSTNRVVIMMNTLVRGRMGGTEVFADELVSRLHKVGVHNSYVDVIASTETPLNSATQTISLPTAVAGTGGAARLANLIVNAVRVGNLRKLIGRQDLAFYPFSAVTPRLKPTHGIVVTIHDLQHRDLPELFTLGQRFYRYLTYERPAKSARIVTVVSDFSAESVHSQLGIPFEKIRRIYPGIDHEFFQPKLENSPSSASRFVYYPARGLPHKNHVTLLAAMEIVRASAPDLELVLTGADGDRIGILPDFVRHEGHVSRERVRDLYRTASTVVFPSLYEGFGFPPIEAMASGCPVVVSNAGSLPEVCGDAAEIVIPTDPESIAQGILRVLEDPFPYIKRGIVNAQRFNWDECARSHDELFAELCVST